MVTTYSLLENLQEELITTKTFMMELLDASTILRAVRDNSGILIVRPDYYWAPLNDNGLIIQTKVLQSITQWFETLEFLIDNKPERIRSRFNDNRNFIIEWMERVDGGWCWTIPSSISEAKAILNSKVEALQECIEWLKQLSNEEYILIPDTNALVKNPEIQTYGTNIGQNRFTIVFIPTVLSELDKLKITHRDETFRNKVESIINRIKGLRNQGNLQKGVTIYKTVTVKMLAQEPNMDKTLQWLDKENNDDRIIASCLEIQKAYPGATLILVTTDINHQNKAEAANLPYIEPPIQHN